MFKVSQLVALGAGAAVITLGLVAAEARDGRPGRKPEPAAPIVAATATQATSVEKAEVGQAAAEKIVQIPACARKVKVVYSGYGEGDRAACQSPTN